MEAEQVTNKIMSEARAQADKILSEAKARLAVEKAQVDRQLQEYHKQTAELAEKAGTDEKAHILAAARMAAARDYLAEKRRLLDEVFEKAKGQFTGMPDEQYRELMKKLMLRAVETGDEEIVVGQHERRIDHEFIKYVNRELGPGYKGNLRLSDKRLPISAGFVLRRGNIKTNASLEVMLSEARNELETELSRLLFEAK
jgi:V/A-type H+-transporting ATPase subunit E